VFTIIIISLALSSSSHSSSEFHDSYYRFRDEYVEEEVKEAVAAVRREYKIYRQVMGQWLGMNMRLTFGRWRQYVQDKKGNVRSFSHTLSPQYRYLTTT
jgi:hypothetical protein